DAQRVRLQAEASADAEAIRLRTVASAQAEAIRQVNQAISEGGQGYLALRQLEMIPEIAPAIANALAQARLINISSDGKGAAGGATDQITGVIQTILAAQLVNQSLRIDGKQDAVSMPRPEPAPKATDVVISPVVTEPPKYTVPPIASKRSQN